MSNITEWDWKTIIVTGVVSAFVTFLIMYLTLFRSFGQLEKAVEVLEKNQAAYSNMGKLEEAVGNLKSQQAEQNRNIEANTDNISKLKIILAQVKGVNVRELIAISQSKNLTTDQFTNAANAVLNMSQERATQMLEQHFDFNQKEIDSIYSSPNDVQIKDRNNGQ